MKRPPDILSGSPWLEQMPNFRDQKAVREAATVGAVPIAGLLHLPKREAEKQLKEALQKIYIPGEQQCAVLLNLIGDLRGVIGERYPDARRFLANVIAKEAPATIQPVRCLTGLAGIGKSCLLEALKRLLKPQTASFGRVYPDTQIKYVQAVTVNTTTSNRDLLMPLANPAFIAGRTALSVDALQKHVQLWFQRMGVGLLLVDELQFLTQSQTANTRVAQVLLMMGYLGVPVLYAANYSLVHRLLGRPQEERQRLLVNPIDLRPEDPDSTTWQDIVAEYVSVAPGVLLIDPAWDAKELNFLAGGITRVLRFLVEGGFARACERGAARAMTMDDIRAFYRSGEFASMREDVEAVDSLGCCQLLREKRLDLVSPFQGDEGGHRLSRGRSKVTSRGSASLQDLLASQPMVEPPAVTHLRHSTLSADARKLLATQSGEVELGTVRTSSGRKSGGRVKVTADSLYAGAQLARTLTTGPKFGSKGGKDDGH